MHNWRFIGSSWLEYDLRHERQEEDCEAGLSFRVSDSTSILRPHAVLSSNSPDQCTGQRIVNGRLPHVRKLHTYLVGSTWKVGAEQFRHHFFLLGQRDYPLNNHTICFHKTSRNGHCYPAAGISNLHVRERNIAWSCWNYDVCQSYGNQMGMLSQPCQALAYL